MGRSGWTWMLFQRSDRTWAWTGYKGVRGRVDDSCTQNWLEVGPFKNQAMLKGDQAAGREAVED